MAERAGAKAVVTAQANVRLERLDALNLSPKQEMTLDEVVQVLVENKFIGPQTLSALKQLGGMIGKQSSYYLDLINTMTALHNEWWEPEKRATFEEMKSN